MKVIFKKRVVAWAFPLEFVGKCRVKSGVQCVTNGAENSTEQLAKPNIFSLFVVHKAESSDTKT